MKTKNPLKPTATYKPNYQTPPIDLLCEIFFPTDNSFLYHHCTEFTANFIPCGFSRVTINQNQWVGQILNVNPLYHLHTDRL